MAKSSSFRNYLQRNKDRAATMLLDKAYRANQIAKISVGKQRAILYELKRRHLSAALKLTPESFFVDSLSPLGMKYVLVGITTKAGFRFHVVTRENEKEATGAPWNPGNGGLAA